MPATSEQLSFAAPSSPPSPAPGIKTCSRCCAPLPASVDSPSLVDPFFERLGDGGLLLGLDPPSVCARCLEGLLAARGSPSAAAGSSLGSASVAETIVEDDEEISVDEMGGLRGGLATPPLARESVGVPPPSPPSSSSILSPTPHPPTPPISHNVFPPSSPSRSSSRSSAKLTHLDAPTPLLPPAPSSAPTRISTPLLPTREETPSSSAEYIVPTHRPAVLDLITERVPAQGRDCIYPGSRFKGTQKSGRNSYDVEVTILNVDFASSLLTGCLTICGLTEEHPVLTTFFEGEIIGNRFGFRTDRWEASEQHDLTHWQRFPLFRPLKSLIRSNPGWTIPSSIVPPAPISVGSPLSPTSSWRRSPNLEGDKNEYFGKGLRSGPGGGIGPAGGLFMRFKEQHLVYPSISSVNGASFAGFYYVCVEFSPPPPPVSLPVSRVNSSPSTASTTPASSFPPSSVVSRATSPRPFRARSPSVSSASTSTTGRPGPGSRRSSIGGGPGGDRSSSAGTVQGDSASSAEEIVYGTAVLSGFYYFHSNSEPFQELSLRHVKERTLPPAFEFR